MRHVIVAFLLVFALSTAKAQTPTPKETVLAFYKMPLSDMHPKEAFAQYMSPDFVEHSSDSPGGTAQAAISYLNELIKKAPSPGGRSCGVSLKAIWSFFTSAPLRRPMRLRLSSVRSFESAATPLQKHWDIVQHAPEHPVNPNPIF